MPALAYVFVGFLMVLVDPSPKFHNHDVGELVEVSVKVTVRLLAVKLATGGAGDTVTVLVLVLDPMLLVTLRDTLYVLAVVKVTGPGFCSVLVDPFPKVHNHEVGFPVELLVKLTTSGAFPLLGDTLNKDTGATGMLVAVTVLLLDEEPAALETVRVMVYVPGTLYRTVDGFFCVLVDPFPKFQDHAVGKPPVEVSVKATLSGTVPDILLELKEHTGGVGTGSVTVTV